MFVQKLNEEPCLGTCAKLKRAREVGVGVELENLVHLSVIIYFAYWCNNTVVTLKDK